MSVIPDVAKRSHARGRCACWSIQESPSSARGDSCIRRNDSSSGLL